MQKFIGGIGCFWDETKYEGTLALSLRNVVIVVARVH